MEIPAKVHMRTDSIELRARTRTSMRNEQTWVLCCSKSPMFGHTIRASLRRQRGDPSSRVSMHDNAERTMSIEVE